MTACKLKGWMIAVLQMAVAHSALAQTMVSGGIFNNTTWTKANSPYIVTGDIVVFSGNTLTIEPGVEVRFDDTTGLELRGATLIANGTSVDSITFTSNSPNPVLGSWWISASSGNVSYCNFHYATTGLGGYVSSITNSVFSYNQRGCFLSGIPNIIGCTFTNNAIGLYFDRGTVSNCNIVNNATGIISGGNELNRINNCRIKYNTEGLRLRGNAGSGLNACKVDNCTISNNAIGITGTDNNPRNLHIKNSVIDSNSSVGIYLAGGSSGHDSVSNCQITRNGVGLDATESGSYRITQNNIDNNGIGIKRDNYFGYIICNRICNSTTYDFYWSYYSDIDMSGNYWCTTDSAAIAAKIYDAYDDINLGIVTFLPVDTSQCYLGPRVSITGDILTEAGIPVPGATVLLSGDDTQNDVTDTAGHYSFLVEPGGHYTITPSKSNDSIANNGVSLADVLLMRRHALGIAPLPSPYKIIAAAEVNADGDTTITTQDIIFTRSLILGNITSFPTNRLWQFVSSDYVFPDTQHPFPFPSTRTYTNITTNQTNQDFIGIKLGDVNGSWDGNIP